MKYSEVKKDLFTVDESWHLAHCISADAKMGAGIAVQFKKRFNLAVTQMVGQLGQLHVGTAVVDGDSRIFNLVTKKRYFDKPTIESFTAAVMNLKYRAEAYDVKKIAMPAIGAGLDRLDWENNRQIIKDVFEDTDIEIMVCML